MTNYKNPEVRILFSDLLFYGESKKLTNINNEQLNYIEFQEKERAYRQAWSEKSEKILTGMHSIYGLQFYKPVIDVTLATGFIPKSKPLIINFKYEPDEFVDVLSHELLHNIFTDNQYIQHGSNKNNLLLLWNEIIGKQDDRSVLIHIFVHSGLKAIYLDILNEPYRLERDIEQCQQLPIAYRKAWDFVENNDYQDINLQIRKLYKKLA
ncbi:hypothetical protein KA025_00255 [Candidatus Saccharibacteria bacterium]|nr:hypothetical protein [Candidatus Saccharibacteria bacterium]MBP7834503.1 hypothetical protein [Candidatus Saccharibacteria bacterium]